MIFDALDDSIWVPDHKEWEEYNRKNMAQRKQEWRNIAPILKQFAFMTRGQTGYLNIHKSLFFKGRFPTDYKEIMASDKRQSIQGGEKFFFCFPLFYLWYHPTLSEHVVEKFFEKLTNDPFIYRHPTHISAIGISTMLIKFFRVQKEYGSFRDYGMMGGREEILAPYFLLGSKSGTSENSFRTGWFNPSLMSLLEGMSSGNGVLRGKTSDRKLGEVYRVNPYGTGQYVWPKASHYIQRHFKNEIQNVEENKNFDVILKIIDNAIERVLFFEEHPKTDKEDPFAIAYKDRLISQYENNEFAEWLFERFVKREKIGLEIG